MQSSIPFNIDPAGSYNVTIFKSDGTAIPFGSAGGSWIVDPRPGVVRFFALGNTTGVGEATPILASFFRYVGATGGTTSGQVNEMITTSSNSYTAKQIFDGGSDGVTNDQLAAIQIDSQSISDLAVGELMNALQFGANADQSWRIAVQKTGTSASMFLVQARESGVWVTKSPFTSP